jgi:trehalose 2-sulfotransferase
MTEIILCATQRCGSTMIVEDMRNTGALGMPEEWFIPWQKDRSDEDLAKDLAGIRRRASGPNGVSAIKVMANQLSWIENNLKQVIKPPPGPMFFRFHKVFEKAVWVWLRRDDIVAQAVSRVMAQQTGINHATSGEAHFAGKLLVGYHEDYNDRAQYNYDAILRECTAITLENLAWQRFFENFGITPLKFVYENVASDPTLGHLDLVAAAVGLDAPLTKQGRKLVKVGNARNEDFVKNFYRDAAAREFRNS